MQSHMVSRDGEEGLIRRARDGEAAAFEILLENSRGELEKYIRHRVGARFLSRMEPEDVIQETCARAWGTISRVAWTGDGTFVRWLKGIARHVVLQQAGRRELEQLNNIQADGLRAAAPIHPFQILACVP